MTAAPPASSAAAPSSVGRRAGIARLPKRADFLRIQAAGRKYVAASFILQIADRPAVAPPTPGPRVGFTVTKRVGNAVVRNRAKRRLRALARTALAPVARADLDYVLIGRAGAVERDFADMTKDLAAALRRLRALAPSDPAPEAAS
ncbi:MAG: ribonuclease P protein component [Rhodospirillales bacterium]|nr:MAG: ribonuclease P protein component [Rhodospirillales bacterium]